MPLFELRFSHMDSFQGFPRKQGRCGVRHYVLVVALVGCVNSIVQHIAWQTGAHPITHEKGCLETEHEHQETFQALYGVMTHPNVGGVLLVGLGCEQIRKELFIDALRAFDIPFDAISVQDIGSAIEAETTGIEKVRSLQYRISKINRETMSASHLVVGVQCGGSDWTTALVANPSIGVMADCVVAAGGTIIMSEVNGFSGSEFLVARNAATPEVGLQILDMVDELRAEYFQKTGQRVEDANPTPGNKAGGITTLAEKSMGNIRKMGSTPVQGIVRLGMRIPRPGVWILDQRTHGPDHYVTTGFAMMGAHITVFSSGRGSPAGSAVMPVIKITGNNESFKKMPGIFDFNASSAHDEQSLQETGQQLYAFLLEIANGRQTLTEQSGNSDFVVPREERLH